MVAWPYSWCLEDNEIMSCLTREKSDAGLDNSSDRLPNCGTTNGQIAHLQLHSMLKSFQ